MLRILPILFSFILCLTTLTPPSYATEPVIGQPTPTLVLHELNGTFFDLGAQRGRVVIVHFWATWCPSCREEMSVLDRFYMYNHAKGVDIIAVSLDKPRKQDEVQAFMQSFGFPAAMVNEATANGFGAPASIPVTYIIDGKGVLRARMTPTEQILTVKRLEDTVEPLLGNNILK